MQLSVELVLTLAFDISGLNEELTAKMISTYIIEYRGWYNLNVQKGIPSIEEPECITESFKEHKSGYRSFKIPVDKQLVLVGLCGERKKLNVLNLVKEI